MSFVVRTRIWLMLASLVAFVVPSSVNCHPQSDLATLYDQARAFEKSGDYLAAERVYLRTLELAPGNPEALKRLGVVEQTELKFPESIAHFNQVLSLDAQYPEVNFFLGVSYLGRNDFTNAIQSFEKELSTSKPHPRCRYYLGIAFQSAGRMEEAISAFNGAVTKNPKDADALYQLARIYKNASIHVIDRLRSVDSDSFQLHALLGEFHADEGQYAEAIKEYQAALAKRPDAPGIHFAIGVAYWVLREMEPAKKEFLDALHENPNDALTNMYLGDIAVRDQKYQEALGYLRIAENGQPGTAQLHLLLGKCYYGQKELEKAKNEFLAAIEADSREAQPHFLLAEVYRDLDNPQESAKQLAEYERLSNLEKEKALESGPKN